MADARQFLTFEIAALCNIAGVIPRTVENYEHGYLIVRDDIVIGDIPKIATFDEWRSLLAEMLKNG